MGRPGDIETPNQGGPLTPEQRAALEWAIRFLEQCSRGRDVDIATLQALLDEKGGGIDQVEGEQARELLQPRSCKVERGHESAPGQESQGEAAPGVRVLPQGYVPDVAPPDSPAMSASSKGGRIPALRDGDTGSTPVADSPAKIAAEAYAYVERMIRLAEEQIGDRARNPDHQPHYMLYLRGWAARVEALGLQPSECRKCGEPVLRCTVMVCATCGKDWNAEHYCALQPSEREVVRHACSALYSLADEKGGSEDDDWSSEVHDIRNALTPIAEGKEGT